MLDNDCHDRDLITFGGFVDRVYLDAPNRVVLRNGLGKTIAIENDGYVIYDFLTLTNLDRIISSSRFEESDLFS